MWKISCHKVLGHISDYVNRRVCKHSFSKAAIREYLSNVARKQCPTSGCNQFLGLGDLYDDKALKRKVQEASRRERMRESDDEDGDVVE